MAIHRRQVALARWAGALRAAHPETPASALRRPCMLYVESFLALRRPDYVRCRIIIGDLPWRTHPMSPSFVACMGRVGSQKSYDKCWEVTCAGRWSRDF